MSGSSCIDVRRVLEDNIPDQRGGGTGITTFISTELRKGRPFSRPNPFSKQNGRSAGAVGQHVGRLVDAHFRSLVEDTPIPKTGKTATRARTIFASLKQMGIQPIASQVFARHEELGLKSYIDAIGVTPKGVVVVIELKSTRSTVEEHEHLYSLPVSGHCLANGVQDTEINHHRLQAGFGVLALRRTYQDLAQNCTIEAVVAVSCSNGTRVYRVPAMYYSSLLYARHNTPLKSVSRRPKRGRVKTPKPSSPVVSTWPSGMVGLSSLLEQYGYVESLCEERKANVPFSLLRPIHPPGEMGCAIVIKTQWSELTRRHRRAYSKSVIDESKKRNAKPFVIARRNGRWAMFNMSMDT